METIDMIKPSKRKRQKRRDKRMAEELIECYRYGGWSLAKKKGYDKKHIGKEFEHAAQKENMKIRSGGTKELNDNLKPLIRYLESKQGKYWDKVYSDLCKKMDKNSMIGQYLFDHLLAFVYTKVIIKKGKIMVHDNGDYCELFSGFYPRFYVHPKSGVLLKVKKKNPRWFGTMDCS